MMVSLQGGVGIHKIHAGHTDKESGVAAKNTISRRDASSLSDRGLVLKEMSESASQKHALSERKRRKRINAHYDSLRQFFPRLHKADKASVLSETVRRLKELKSMIGDVSQSQEDSDRSSSNKSNRSFFMPGENDEVTVNYCEGGEKITVQAIICCEDRLDLNRGFTEAIQSVGGKAVKAEMATVGGRTKVKVLVELQHSGGKAEEDVGLLRRTLKALVENRVLGRTGFVGQGFAEPELIGLGRRFVDGHRPSLYDQIENGYADGLVVRSY